MILTDLVMPDMEGLELVQQVRAQHPHISVILVTAYGSEEVAMQALRAGAANYIPKKRLARDLVPTLRQVLSIATTTRERRRILRCMVRRESAFVLENDPELILPLLKLMHEEIEGLGICDPTRPVAGRASRSRKPSAMHFSTAISRSAPISARKTSDCSTPWPRSAADTEPYCSRRIRVQVQLDREAARFVVADDGPGFDTTIFDRPVQPEDLNRIGGRGLLLIRTFMDHVSFNETGNQITMVKYRSIVLSRPGRDVSSRLTIDSTKNGRVFTPSVAGDSGGISQTP